MRTRAALRSSWVVGLALLFEACSEDGGTSPGRDAGGPVDASIDAPTADAGADSEVEAGDAGADSGADAGDAGPAMSYFVTSAGIGRGGDLGGIAGADAHCRALAAAVGSTKTWFAYISVANGPGGQPVHARDRIGAGPWYNAKGRMLAPDLTALHPTVDPAVDRAGYIAVKPADDSLYWDERGVQVPAAEHDILTGSTAEGRVAVGKTCRDWTSNADTNPAAGDVAQVGHSDTPANVAFSPSWNSAHESAGCSQDPGLKQRGGSGRLYCFATN